MCIRAPRERVNPVERDAPQEVAVLGDGGVHGPGNHARLARKKIRQRHRCERECVVEQLRPGPKQHGVLRERVAAAINTWLRIEQPDEARECHTGEGPMDGRNELKGALIPMSCPAEAGPKPPPGRDGRVSKNHVIAALTLAESKPAREIETVARQHRSILGTRLGILLIRQAHQSARQRTIMKPEGIGRSASHHGVGTPFGDGTTGPGQRLR